MKRSGRAGEMERWHQNDGVTPFCPVSFGFGEDCRASCMRILADGRKGPAGSEHIVAPEWKFGLRI
jgi:hypothetical protein